jgi:hypothetical protein
MNQKLNYDKTYGSNVIFWDVMFSVVDNVGNRLPGHMAPHPPEDHSLDVHYCEKVMSVALTHKRL